MIGQASLKTLNSGEVLARVGAMTTDFSELDQAQKLLSYLEIPYFYIGGWGIDLFLGYVSRNHSDIEVTVYRDEQKPLFSWARSDQIVGQGYSLHVVDPPGTANTPVWDGHTLTSPVHQLQLYHQDDRIVDIMLSDLNYQHPSGVIWQFRRDPRIIAPKSQIEGFFSLSAANTGVESSKSVALPYHAPEILLLYKSKRNVDKDRKDRDRAWVKMSLSQQQWLIDALQQYDATHPWLDELLPL